MGYSAEEAAFDCWRIVNANMSQGVRRITAGKGVDPKDMCMLAYGGNGPAFAAIQAEDLGIDKVLVPKASPDVLGTGHAGGRSQYRRRALLHLRRPTVSMSGKLTALWEELGERATKYFADARFLG